jgi:hypothetical protein
MTDDDRRRLVFLGRPDDWSEDGLQAFAQAMIAAAAAHLEETGDLAGAERLRRQLPEDYPIPTGPPRKWKRWTVEEMKAIGSGPDTDADELVEELRRRRAAAEEE